MEIIILLIQRLASFSLSEIRDCEILIIIRELNSRLLGGNVTVFVWSVECCIDWLWGWKFGDFGCCQGSLGHLVIEKTDVGKPFQLSKPSRSRLLQLNESTVSEPHVCTSKWRTLTLSPCHWIHSLKAGVTHQQPMPRGWMLMGLLVLLERLEQGALGCCSMARTGRSCCPSCILN